MTPGITVGLLIVLGIAVVVIRPLVIAQKERQRLESTPYDQEMENLLFQREAALASIRDLQMDHSMGKIGDEDFAELDARQRAHAIELLKRLDERGLSDVDSFDDETLDAYIEQAVAEVREGKRAPVPKSGPAEGLIG